MTVKCLSTVDKAYIVDCFIAKTMTIKDLVYAFKRSRRTIIRVLEEAGVDPGVKHRGQRPQLQLQLNTVLKTMGQTVVAVDPQPRTNSWFRRIGAFFGKFRYF